MAGVKRNGFSIIEILVGINLTMLVISMVFGFYLFFTRFTITMEKQVTTRLRITDMLSKIERCINRSDEYIVKNKGKNLSIIFNDADSLLFLENKISLSGFGRLENIEKTKVRIGLKTGNNIYWTNRGNISGDINYNLSEGLHSGEISSLVISINNGRVEFENEYFNSGGMMKDFINKGKDDF